MKSEWRGQMGFSLIELIIAIGIFSIFILTFTTTMTNMMKTSNFVEFQLKRTELRTSLIHGFLNNPQNCRCLFRGADPFSVAGTALLTGVTPTAIGPYSFVTPSDCTTATMPFSLVNSTGIDGLKATNISLRNITNTSGVYIANFEVLLGSTKEIAGPNNLKVTIPVSVKTTPAGAGQVTFESCSTQSLTGAMVPVGAYPVVLCNMTLPGYQPWDPCPAGADNMISTATLANPNAGAWTALDLKPFGVPGHATEAVLRIYGTEVNIYLRKPSESSVLSHANVYFAARDNTDSMNEVSINIEGANGVLYYKAIQTDPPTWGGWILLKGYK